MPKADVDCLKQIRGFENVNPATEFLTMLNPIYGLKDAPRAWRKKLHQVLVGWLQCQQLYAEAELFCAHKGQQVTEKDIVGRAQAHNLEQQEIAEPRQVVQGRFTPGNLQCLLSVHVGDIKGIAPNEIADSLLKHLNDSVGQRKADYDSFLHVGIQHEHASGSVLTHQYVYVDSISPIKAELYSGKDDAALCDGPCHDAYRSVFGAVVWTVLTRAGLAVYVQALQRRARAPRVTDCKRLNFVIRYVKNTNAVSSPFVYVIH